MSKLGLARYQFRNGLRSFTRIFVPYLKSRVFNSHLRPVVCILFTDWRCNIDCHYCFQFDNHREGMSLETAKSSIDWLKKIGCRVIALMGGEPLVRRKFILDVIRYATENGSFVYLPTNGRLLTKDYIDALAEAEVSAINLAVDCIEEKPGLPKALMAIEPQFRYLVQKQEEYGYILFFNMNITSVNLKDVKMLTEIAHDEGLAMDYHINEPPHDMVDTDHYRSDRDGLYIRPDQFDEVDELIDWIIEKNRKGYTMVNSIAHLQAIKDRMRNKPRNWNCGAGQNGILIRPDGSLTPCFDLITYDHDWGRIWEPKFDPDALEEIKRKCVPKCLSTCFFTTAHYYQPCESLKWVAKHVRIGRAR